MKIIVNSQIYLRLLLPTDDIQLHNLINQNREYLKNWLSWLDLVVSIDDTQTFIETATYKHNNNEGSTFAIFYQQQLVGLVGFNQFDFANKFASVGYWLADKHTGAGIMTKALQHLLDYGFTDLGLHKIELRCAEKNTKSRAVALRLNFTYEAILRDCEWLYDCFIHHAVYSIIKSEFKMK